MALLRTKISAQFWRWFPKVLLLIIHHFCWVPQILMNKFAALLIQTGLLYQGLLPYMWEKYFLKGKKTYRSRMFVWQVLLIYDHSFIISQWCHLFTNLLTHFLLSFYNVFHFFRTWLTYTFAITNKFSFFSCSLISLRRGNLNSTMKNLRVFLALCTIICKAHDCVPYFTYSQIPPTPIFRPCLCCLCLIISLSPANFTWSNPSHLPTLSQEQLRRTPQFHENPFSHCPYVTSPKLSN